MIMKSVSEENNTDVQGAAQSRGEIPVLQNAAKFWQRLSLEDVFREIHILKSCKIRAYLTISKLFHVLILWTSTKNTIWISFFSLWEEPNNHIYTWMNKRLCLWYIVKHKKQAIQIPMAKTDSHGGSINVLSFALSICLSVCPSIHPSTIHPSI